MTLLYSLFGLPGTFDEFVDRAKRKNTSVRVFAVQQRSDPLLGLDAHYSVTLKAGKISFKYFKDTAIGFMSAGGTPNSGKAIEYMEHQKGNIVGKVLAKAHEAVKILRLRGIEASFVKP